VFWGGKEKKKEERGAFSNAELLYPFKYVNREDVDKQVNRPWVDIVLPPAGAMQIGMLGHKEDFNVKTCLIHAVNNFAGLPYFWNIEQFLRICEYCKIIPSYDAALNALNNGEGIPAEEGKNWNNMFLDSKGSFYSLLLAKTWKESELQAKKEQKGKSGGLLAALCELA
jgi:hypothetical protein